MKTTSKTGSGKKTTSGTKEWADSNVNCYYGCSNNCRYCYAKMMAIRFKRETEYTWMAMEPNYGAINKNYKKRKGRVMFPSSHDITPESLEGCLIVLKKLLKAGNRVLITTKPNPECILEIIRLGKYRTQLGKYKDLIQFRFTITSISENTLKFWEPNAPSFKERMDSLLMAYMKGFKTSVSIEPFLDRDPTNLIRKVAPYCTESIWLGKMNYIRVNGIPMEEKEYYDKIKSISSWINIQKIVEKIRTLPENIKSKVRLKDSIVNMYHKRGLEVKI